MITIQSPYARRVLAEEADQEVVEFLRLSAKYFGHAKAIQYEGKNEEAIKERLLGKTK